MNEVAVDKSVSGAYWRMKYRGKVAFEEEEPSEQAKKAFRESVDRAFKYGDGGNYPETKHTVQQADR
jgi:hypothetical protein